MRAKVAKALRREARQFAEQTGRTKDKLDFMRHGFSFVLVEEALSLQGLIRRSKISGIHDHAVVVDGPRFFLKALKRAYRRGLLRRPGREASIEHRPGPPTVHW
jgi:hypothetical protein